MKADDYRNFLVSSIPSAKSVAGGREVLCRCFYCGDSKNITHAHFYISIPENDNELSFFDCKKCPAQGVVTHQKLLEWGIFDANMGMELLAHNKRAYKNPSNSIFKNNIMKMDNNYTSIDTLTKFKLSYLNNRLGLNLSIQECLEQGIVFNLFDLLKQNHITKYTRYDSIMELLDTSFIGFLSIDNKFVTLRNLELKNVQLPKSIDKRYCNYNIFGEYDNTHRFYRIPANINLLKPIELHMAEGAFDILSIKYNLRKNAENAIFTSIGGNGYAGIVRYFITAWQLINLELHFYVDNDIEQWKIEDIATSLQCFGFPFYIHRNGFPGEKDFGVPMERIHEITTQVM